MTALLLASLTLVLGACSAAASSRPAPPSPEVTPAPLTATPTARAIEVPVSPSPLPSATAPWTQPQRVIAHVACGGPALGIDAASGYHLAASCAGGLVYATSNDRQTWSLSTGLTPEDRLDLGPQFAFQGRTAYLAFTRFIPDGACGPSYGESVGFFYRRRALPDGVWSDPVGLGLPGDILGELRVDGSTFHATVGDGLDQPTYYERIVGDEVERELVTEASGATSMRIGPDGAARIVYRTGESLGYATWTASGLATARIPGTGPRDWNPHLALDDLGRAHILWTRRPSPYGCASEEDQEDDGTYYATDSRGSWTSARITRDLGETSLQVEGPTGRIHAIVAGSGGALTYYTGVPGVDLRGPELLPVTDGGGYVLRRDPATGGLVLAYAGGTAETPGIYILTRE